MAWIWCHGEGAEKSHASEMKAGLADFDSWDGFRQQTGQCHHLPRAFETACAPPGPEDIFCWKICLSVDSVPPHTARTTQRLLSEFWIPADWLPYLSNLNLQVFAIWHILHVKVKAQSGQCMSVYHRRMRPVSGEYIRKSCRSNLLLPVSWR
jgi:hypothetical protein